MPSGVQLTAKTTVTSVDVASGDKLVIIDVSASNAVKLITVAEFQTYLAT